ncbi:hypothetical protein [Nonomuraea sp. GTA35]|uniref:hypothetical protein n=1 Tax=Nonomuraea sp. GTA35 TaxID=1676746 RepID=UPI0035BFF5C5
MDIHTALNAREQLDLLRLKLEARGWLADMRGSDAHPLLHVRNPADHAFHDSVAFKNGTFCWNWGSELGSADSIDQVADAIMHVLRVVVQ